MPSAVALIPAREGSERVPGKNVRPLAGHPLIAYTIAAAHEAAVFDAVVVSTDGERTAEIARHYGAEVPALRPKELASAKSPDVGWVEHMLTLLPHADAFAILRPTSPFRKAETIRRAWDTFLAEEGVDSLRAVEKCKQHPGKMWVVRGHRMFPLLPIGPKEQPWHSSQYPTLPEVYVQNASLEIAWSRVIFENRTIAGDSYVPFISEGDEGYDVNDVQDWIYAEYLVANGEASLPPVSETPFPVEA